jgi:hypothetical protein
MSLTRAESCTSYRLTRVGCAFYGEFGRAAHETIRLASSRQFAVGHIVVPGRTEKARIAFAPFAMNSLSLGGALVWTNEVSVGAALDVTFWSVTTAPFLLEGSTTARVLVRFVPRCGI